MGNQRVTLRRINNAIRAAGFDAELVRGDGYFYFTGPAVDLSPEQGVYGVYRLSDLSVDKWVDELRAKVLTG